MTLVALVELIVPESGLYAIGDEFQNPATTRIVTRAHLNRTIDGFQYRLC